jgi:hypothetical protein
VDQLNVRVKGDTCQLLVNDFSTTDVTSKAASQVVLMDTMKHYFPYTMEITCGIPEVALHGSLEDWHKLLEKTRGIRALGIGLDWWLDVLEPVLEKLIETHSGHVDADRWSHVMTKQVSYGSGGDREWFEGWVCAFFPYTSEGTPTHFEHGLSRGDVPTGLVNCPFDLDDNGHVTKNVLVAGSFGARVMDDGGVAPYIGWLVKRERTEDEALKEDPYFDESWWTQPLAAAEPSAAEEPAVSENPMQRVGNAILAFGGSILNR